MTNEQPNNKIGCVGWGLLIIVGLCILFAISGINTSRLPSSTSTRAPLPATGECVSHDMNIVDCSSPLAEMSMTEFKSTMKFICDGLDNKRISEMSAKELRLQGACRAVSEGHWFDH